MKIDAIIPWVDGADPRLAEKRAKYLYGDIARRPDVAGKTRYEQVGEIYWCVASINRFAPWINKIYIVTDGQDPRVEEFMRERFGGDAGEASWIPVEVVDHTVLFRGYEQYLPTFNSRAIEAMFWRIPGLSEHALYFNDDFLLTAPVEPEDFFLPDGRSICVASWHLTFVDLALYALKPRRGGMRKASFKYALLSASAILGHGWRYPRFNHTPRPMLTSYFEELYAQRPELLERNISFRFRSNKQFNVVALQFMALLRAGRCVVRPVRDYLFYLEPRRRPNYIPRKMASLQRRVPKFCCFNNFDLASEADLKLVEDWIENRLGITK